MLYCIVQVFLKIIHCDVLCMCSTGGVPQDRTLCCIVQVFHKIIHCAVLCRCSSRSYIVLYCAGVPQHHTLCRIVQVFHKIIHCAVLCRCSTRSSPQGIRGFSRCLTVCLQSSSMVSSPFCPLRFQTSLSLQFKFYHVIVKCVLSERMCVCVCVCVCVCECVCVCVHVSLCVCVFYVGVGVGACV